MLIRLTAGVWATARKEEKVKMKRSSAFFMVQRGKTFSKLEQEFIQVKSFL